MWMLENTVFIYSWIKTLKHDTGILQNFPEFFLTQQTGTMKGNIHVKELSDGVRIVFGFCEWNDNSYWTMECIGYEIR